MKNKYRNGWWLVWGLVVVCSCRPGPVERTAEIQIAFLSDVHLQNIYGHFDDCDFKGALNPGNGRYVLARTMGAQLHSTRLFNENYFAFLAALDDVVRRHVRYVVMPGDLTDDGQPLNVRGLKNILHEYQSNYGIHFLLTTGNHDAVRPFTMESGKTDYLGDNGKEQIIMSREGMVQPGAPGVNPVVITRDIRKLGYDEALDELADFGFFPKKTDLYWETPFSDYAYADYSFQKARAEADLVNRQYPVPPYNHLVPDVSYVVEPVEGVWFLALDANVYVPKEAAANEPRNPENYNGAGVGYNQVLTHKKHLMNWIEKVSKEADERGKTLIVFSHYPTIDFNDDATAGIRELMGEGAMDLYRVPAEQVARTFAEAGIKMHFGGHMHINDTGLRQYPDGNFLVNVQVPSLSAYIPAYKLLTIHAGQLMEIETVPIDSVPRFKELFPLYEKEYAVLDSLKSPDTWDRKILSSPDYHSYTARHLSELVRLRYLQEDWPADFRDFLLKSTGNDLLDHLRKYVPDSVAPDPGETAQPENWTGFELIRDFYRLRSADKLAIADIGKTRLAAYQRVLNAALKIPDATCDDRMMIDLKRFAVIFNQFLNGAPAGHFYIDLSGKDNRIIWPVLPEPSAS